MFNSKVRSSEFLRIEKLVLLGGWMLGSMLGPMLGDHLQNSFNTSSMSILIYILFGNKFIVK